MNDAHNDPGQPRVVGKVVTYALGLTAVVVVSLAMIRVAPPILHDAARTLPPLDPVELKEHPIQPAQMPPEPIQARPAVQVEPSPVEAAAAPPAVVVPIPVVEPAPIVVTAPAPPKLADRPPMRDPDASPQPHYPIAAWKAGVGGSVDLLATVAPSGEVSRLQLDRSSGRADLDAAAAEAVRAWRFVPALRDGDPVEATTRIVINFRLSTSPSR